jgi:hypothetical protein
VAVFDVILAWDWFGGITIFFYYRNSNRETGYGSKKSNAPSKLGGVNGVSNFVKSDTMGTQFVVLFKS